MRRKYGYKFYFQEQSDGEKDAEKQLKEEESELFSDDSSDDEPDDSSDDEPELSEDSSDDYSDYSDDDYDIDSHLGDPIFLPPPGPGDNLDTYWECYP